MGYYSFRGIWIIISLFIYCVHESSGRKHNVIYAINAGGESHTDSYGIHYEPDPLMGKVGTESDYGRQLLVINRAKQNDEILYQTERYHHDTFGYELPMVGDGEYVLILKFCEVYFNSPNMKVFDVLLNRHTVVSDLDIYAMVGKGTAHDEYVFFSVNQGRLYFKEEHSEIRGNKLKLEFVKGYKDNPKINAIVLIKDYDETMLPRLPSPINDHHTKSTVMDSDIPEHYNTHSHLPPSKANSHPVDGVESNMDNFMNELSEELPQPSIKLRKTSGPKQPNPYSLDESSIILPVFIAIGAFIPLLFCLCRL